jgi:DNA modification methylase
MAGSGTTLVEALLHNRDAIGIDLDPLAILVAQAKTTPLSVPRCAEVGAEVVRNATSYIESHSDKDISDTYSPDAIEFFHYWFDDTVISQLHALVRAIQAVRDPKIRVFLEVVLSSTIITKSGGLSRARDLAHSRPHRDISKQIKQSALDAFTNRLHTAIDSLASITDVKGRSVVLLGDARRLPLEDDSVDLIVTSPPYAANAIDYMRAHKFSLMWLGYEPAKLTRLRSTYIGAELRCWDEDFASPTAKSVLQELQSKDKDRAAVVAFYYRDVEAVLREMLRVLRKGRAAVLVVGSSTIRGVDIKAPTVVGELARHVGFHVVGTAKREIVRDARMMPVSHGTTKNGIEARMHEVGIIGAVNPR